MLCRSPVVERVYREDWLQVLWSDIDYMDRFRDFTLDPVAYAAPKMLVGFPAASQTSSPAQGLLAP